jgi:hypothetical protein
MQVDQSNVRVYYFRAERWPDSMLGCESVSFRREPGETPGFQVVLAVGRHVLDYRTDDRRNRAILCSTMTDIRPAAGTTADRSAFAPDVDLLAIEPPPLSDAAGATESASDG